MIFLVCKFKKVKYTIDKQVVEIAIKGDTGYGASEVLLHKDDNLTAQAAWNEEGYKVDDLWNGNFYDELVSGIQNLIQSNLYNIGVSVDQAFTLEKYHKYLTDELHYALLAEMEAFSANALPVGVRHLEDRVSEMCGLAVTCKNPSLGLKLFHIRIVRPKSDDNNPLHRDVWLDRLRNFVNIYVPLAGSTADSSVCIVPGSHLWKESEIERTLAGAMINGKAYTVPAVTNAKKPLKAIRPNPKPNEILLFSPYLIHGGAVNMNKNATRISLEMRFWRK